MPGSEHDSAVVIDSQCPRPVSQAARQRDHGDRDALPGLDQALPTSAGALENEQHVVRRRAQLRGGHGA
jgi:hypothetical protein